MYLSRLQLDMRSSKVRRDLADPYEMHRTLVRAFAPSEQQKPSRFLWRLEPVGARGIPVVLIQAVADANWGILESLSHYLRFPVETRKVNLPAFVQPGRRYRFRLHANPTVTRQGRRYGLATEEKQIEWLCRQGERIGFKVESVQVTGNDVMRSKANGKDICLQRTSYEGILNPIDANGVIEAMRSGIGPGKAFGCGMLSLARIT